MALTETDARLIQSKFSKRFNYSQLDYDEVRRDYEATHWPYYWALLLLSWIGMAIICRGGGAAMMFAMVGMSFLLFVATKAIPTFARLIAGIFITFFLSSLPSGLVRKIRLLFIFVGYFFSFLVLIWYWLMCLASASEAGASARETYTFLVVHALLMIAYFVLDYFFKRVWVFYENARVANTAYSALYNEAISTLRATNGRRGILRAIQIIRGGATPRYNVERLTQGGPVSQNLELNSSIGFPNPGDIFVMNNAQRPVAILPREHMEWMEKWIGREFDCPKTPIYLRFYPILGKKLGFGKTSDEKSAPDLSNVKLGRISE